MLLKQGSVGNEVKVLQGILYDLNLIVEQPDGIFGANTSAAVKRFQNMSGLNPDGIVGQKTLTALYAAMPDGAKGIEPSLPNSGVMSKQWIIADKTSVEAGYVNNPDDLGGETNHGITKAKAEEHKSNLIRLFGWNGKMRDLTKDMAFYIYGLDYWDKLKLDDISEFDPYIADKLFDIGINAGTGRAGQWFQTLLCVMNKKGKLYPDITVDGVIGVGTLDAFNACLRSHGKTKACWTIMKGLLSQQGHHYINISYKREANETFFMGWMNRLDHNFDLYYKHYNP